jgi:glycerol uptake facilitator-like aquaporin
MSINRALVAELLGTFAVVYFSAGAVCANSLAAQPNPTDSPLHALQPGLIGIALASGLVFAAALAVTADLSGGYLNPAITLMLWVFNRLDNKRTALCLAAQLAGALAAGALLRYTFEDGVLRQAHLGAPHLNEVAFPRVETGAMLAGTSIELVLVFFMVLAIFGANRDGPANVSTMMPAGLIVVAGTIVAGPLTGAAGNPARWFGTVCWEQMLPHQPNPWGDTFVYLAGPIVGALAAGFVVFRVLMLGPAQVTSGPSAAPKQPAVASTVKKK